MLDSNKTVEGHDPFHSPTTQQADSHAFKGVEKRREKFNSPMSKFKISYTHSFLPPDRTASGSYMCGDISLACNIDCRSMVRIPYGGGAGSAVGLIRKLKGARVFDNSVTFDN